MCEAAFGLREKNIGGTKWYWGPLSPALVAAYGEAGFVTAMGNAAMKQRLITSRCVSVTRTKKSY